MKTLTTIISVAMAVTANLLTADNIQTESVSAEAQWLVHLNLDAFRETAIGSCVYESIIKPQSGETPIGLRIKTGDIYEGIHAITAYGNTYQVDSESIGVLLVRTEPNLKSIFEAALIQQEAAGGEDPDFRTVQTDPYAIYTRKDEAFAAILPQDIVVLSNSLDQLLRAVDVVEDRAPGLDESDSEFAGMTRVKSSVFFLATAEGFNHSSAIPPQARIVQLAEAARLVLGEHSDDLFLDLTLKTENEQVRDQLAKIVQGLLALVSLSQVDNQDLAELARNTEVETHGSEVSVALRYPVERVLRLIESRTAPPVSNPKPELDEKTSGAISL